MQGGLLKGSCMNWLFSRLFPLPAALVGLMILSGRSGAGGAWAGRLIAKTRGGEAYPFIEERR